MIKIIIAIAIIKILIKITTTMLKAYKKTKEELKNN